jgi:hypothetical protein
MGRFIFRSRSVTALFLVILLGMAWTGCSTTVKERRDETGKPAESQETKAPPSKYYARYYHFDDVLVPGELNYKQNKSFIYETPQFKAGSLYLTKWWLDIDSLIDFFTYHMEKDNWKLINSYRGKESFLSFSKPDRTCNIRIVGKWNGMTHVEIRVGPLVVKKM